MNIAFNNQIKNKVSYRSTAHNMFLLSQTSLNSQIIPYEIKNAASELLSGKYPKTTTELMVSGNDLMSVGLKGKEIGDMQKRLLLGVYSDNIRNDKEDLLNLSRNI